MDSSVWKNDVNYWKQFDVNKLTELSQEINDYLIGKEEVVITDLSSYPLEQGVLAAAGGWYGWNNQNYKHLVIRTNGREGNVSFTNNGSVKMEVACLKSYAAPTSDSATYTFSNEAAWSSCVYVGVGQSFSKNIATDSNYLLITIRNGSNVDYYPTDFNLTLEKAESEVGAKLAEINTKIDGIKRYANLLYGKPSKLTTTNATYRMSYIVCDVQHKGYASFEFKVNEECTLQIDTGITQQTPSFNIGERKRVSFLVAPKTSSTHGQFSALFTFSQASNHTIEVRNQVGIDLTNVFGIGNELSTQDIDISLSDVSEESLNKQYGYLGSPIPNARNIRSAKADVSVLTTDEGNVVISSAPNPYWNGWKEIGTYGQSKVATIPIYNKVHGTIETDGMMSVIPHWGCWSKNASGGNENNGGHVFHGWTTDRMHRLTMLQNIYRTDEAAIFNYIPGDKAGTREGIFLRLRLGSDAICKGMLLEPIHLENGEYQYTRATVFGRLNIQSSKCLWDKKENGQGADLPVNTIPSSSNAEGRKGDFTFDENFAYFCVAENTWKRIPLQEW